MNVLNVSAALKGGLEYSIPLDYDLINETEFAQKAENYYNLAISNSNGKMNSDVTNALILYSVLCNKKPDNIDYALKTGNLYMLIGKNRYAKGYFYQAMGIDVSKPDSYFYLGELFYKQEQYRKALKMYEKAKERGCINPLNTQRINRIKLMLSEK